MKRILLLLAMFMGGSLSPALADDKNGANGVRVSADDCVACHENQTRKAVYHNNCGSCHVTAVNHARAEEARENAPEGSKPDSVFAGFPTTVECQSCHAQDAPRMDFAFGHHNKAGVQCSDCHGEHKPKIDTLNITLQKGGETLALCATCHQDVVGRLNMRSHHPVKEGGLSCESCHDPHSGNQVSLVGKTAQCTQCHQSVRGPHAFEHAPVAEDCATCHNPHGSPNRKLLSLAEPMLCLQCHSVAGNRHGATGGNANGQVISATALRNCSSCHGAPHGSHVDQHLRF